MLVCASLGACASAPAPLGEALLVVRTDVAIPRRVNRLRIDVHGADGALLESREVSAPRPEDWPISFSLVADREEERLVTVRLRAFLEGHVLSRAELAEQRRASFVEPVVHATIEQACEAAPTLRLGEPLTLRRGAAPITRLLPQNTGAEVVCDEPTDSGSVVARLDVPGRDRYRIEVLAGVPDGARNEPGGDVALSLRRDCPFPTSQIACAETRNAPDRILFPALTLELDPGTYWVVTGGTDPRAPADLTLLANRLNAAVEVAPPPPPVDDPGALEPDPGATIDRLVGVRLAPGVRGTIPVDLHGECFGTPADLANVQSCVDLAGELVPVDTLLSRGRLDRRGPAPLAPWSGDDPVACTVQPRGPGPLLDDEVCIPGGAFLLGDTLALTDLVHRTRPERMRVVAPFLLDVHEMTVGRFREAVRRGLVPLPGDQGVFRNDGPLTPQNVCTWNEGATPGVPAPGVDRESFPLNCVPWEQARAVCRFFGGDLPTEDQWEYAATAAGRPREAQYPWGDELVTCEHAVVERAAVPPNRCAPAFGPTAVDDSSWGGRDVTPQGVIGMAGNVAEWLATGFYPYAHAAWERAGLRGALPAWADSEAPLRATRGGDWAGFALYATASARRSFPATARYDNVGFRCVRPGR